MSQLKIMILSMVIVGTLVFSGYTLFLYSASPCERPMSYKIGRFDSQFGINQEEFKAQITEAELVWERAINKDIFRYNPDASLTVNLIYDQRQLSTLEKQKTESGLSAAESILRNLDRELAAAKNAYEQEKEWYQTAFSSLQNRQQSFEATVANQPKGGVSPAVYQTLQNEAELINIDVTRLNQEAARLNLKAQELNALLDKRNQAATVYNRVAGNYNQKYGHGLEFNQAEYTGSEINIYQFSNKTDLLLALTHEFGHALDMDHVENPKSIMYYLTGNSAVGEVVLSAEDLAELRRVCKI